MDDEGCGMWCLADNLADNLDGVALSLLCRLRKNNPAATNFAFPGVESRSRDYQATLRFTFP